MTRCKFPVYLNRGARKILDLGFFDWDAFLTIALPRAIFEYRSEQYFYFNKVSASL